MISIKSISAIGILLYALSVPFFAGDFFIVNPVTTIYIILISFIISFLIYSGRVFLFNFLIAFYIFKQYLTRPYVNIFHNKLEANELEYILGNDSFYNPAHAEVVFLSLLSLLIFWALGVYLTESKIPSKNYYPWIFREFDKIIFSYNWKFWLFLIIIFIMNFQLPSEISRALVVPETGETLQVGEKLFAYGLIQSDFIIFSCLAIFMFSRINLKQKRKFVLLLPLFIGVIISMFSGGRGALYNYVIFIILYWYFNNANRNLSYQDLKKFVYLLSSIPIVVFFGMIAQSLKQFLNPHVDVIFKDYIANLSILINPFNPDNPLMYALYFNLTELFHRLSHLQAQFIILNNQYINNPWDTFNPIDTFSRIINDLLPGVIFNDVIGINRLFHHIYFDEFTAYSSHMWSIQGTLYIYFGFIFSPLIVLFFAIVFKRYSLIIENIARVSPSFYVFISILFLSFIENGTLERIIPVNIIRPLFTMLSLILFIKILESFFPPKKTKNY